MTDDRAAPPDDSGGAARVADLSKTRPPAAAPCFSCPYRRDVPPGIWHEAEYRKLPPYDAETFAQPTGVFHCHQQDGRVCAGWAGTHGKRAQQHEFELLALRLAARLGMRADVIEAATGYVSPVPLFDSGAQACAHGLAGERSPDAIAIVRRIIRKRSRPNRKGDDDNAPAN